jgi:phosphatidylglycerophosphate synthase
VSYASIVAAALAGLCLWQASTTPVLLLIAPVFCYIRLWLNMLDGMVALESGTASPRGEILNDLPDRISDVLVFVGLAHSGLCSPYSGYWCAIFALLTAYVGMFGQAVGVQREFSGVMSKPWRMVAVHVGAWTTWATLAVAAGVPSFLGLTVLDWTSVLIVAGCVQTIVVRLRRILTALALSPRGGHS